MRLNLRSVLFGNLATEVAGKALYAMIENQQVKSESGILPCLSTGAVNGDGFHAHHAPLE